MGQPIDMEGSYQYCQIVLYLEKCKNVPLEWNIIVYAHTYHIYIYISISADPACSKGSTSKEKLPQQGQQGARSKIWQPCVSKLGGGQKKKTASFLSVQKAMLGHYRLLPRGPFRPSLPRGLNGCNGCSGHLTHNCLM